MKLERISTTNFSGLKGNGYQYVVSSNISGILSEGDDVHNLFVPFKSKEEAEEYVRNNKETYAVNISDAEQEVHEAIKARTGYKFFCGS